MILIGEADSIATAWLKRAQRARRAWHGRSLAQAAAALRSADRLRLALVLALLAVPLPAPPVRAEITRCRECSGFDKSESGRGYSHVAQ